MWGGGAGRRRVGSHHLHGLDEVRHQVSTSQSPPRHRYRGHVTQAVGAHCTANSYENWLWSHIRVHAHAHKTNSKKRIYQHIGRFDFFNKTKLQSIGAILYGIVSIYLSVKCS